MQRGKKQGYILLYWERQIESKGRRASVLDDATILVTRARAQQAMQALKEGSKIA